MCFGMVSMDVGKARIGDKSVSWVVFLAFRNTGVA